MTIDYYSDSLTNKESWIINSNWTHLHYVPGINIESWREWWEEDSNPGYLNNDLSAFCGTKLFAVLPGIFARMGAPRCKKCCAKLGIPNGDGAALNDHSLNHLREGIKDI